MIEPIEDEVSTVLRNAVARATESIGVILNFANDSSSFHPLLRDLETIAGAASQRLSCRCIFSARAQFPELQQYLSTLALRGWKCRQSQAPRTPSILSVDSAELTAWVREGQQGRIITPKTTASSSAQNYARRYLFSHMWEASDSYSDLQDSVVPNEIESGLLHEDLLRSYELPDAEEAIIHISQETWDRLLSRLAQCPEELYQIKPRKFEELVAELLAREGLVVELTPPVRDGGRDILAFSSSIIGTHLYYVECKRYSPKRPVDVSLVRALYGVVEAERATAGIVVTTSDFTKGARQFRESIQYRLDLRNYQDLVRWIRRNQKSPEEK